MLRRLTYHASISLNIFFFRKIIIKFGVIYIHVFVVYFAFFGQSVAEIIQ